MDRLTSEDYFAAGLDLLAESGIAGVTIVNLCMRLNVTKGSFYHHFGSCRDFHERLVRHWEGVYGELRPAMVDAAPTPLERFDALQRATIDRQHAAESALRAWSRSDPMVADVQRRLDDMRIAYTTRTLVECGLPRARARVIATAGLAMLVGFQTRGPSVDLRALRAAVEEFGRLVRAAIAEESAGAGAAPELAQAAESRYRIGRER